MNDRSRLYIGVAPRRAALTGTVLSVLLSSLSGSAQSFPEWHPLYRPYMPKSAPGTAPATAAAADPVDAAPPNIVPAPAEPATPSPDSAPAAPIAKSESAPAIAQVNPPATDPAPEVPSLDEDMLKPKVFKNEVSFAGDFMIGEGQVTLPVGYSIRESLQGVGGSRVQPTVSEVDRGSTYLGGTVSYSYGQSWYLDISYAHGDSSGNVTVDAQSAGTYPVKFEITDDWYQAYVRYNIPARGRRLSAYLRAGATLVDAELSARSLKQKSAAAGDYTQEDTTQDILGNVGFGLSYSLYASRHLRLGLQGEVEGFIGFRQQESFERLRQIEGIAPKKADIDNDLYGGIARGTLRSEYLFGNSGAFKVFGDVGFQVRYTFIDYPDAGSFDELLWGPYVRMGMRYAF
jgi:hypothetical protein